MFRHPVRSGIAFLILGLAAGCVTGPERIQATRTQYNVVLQQTANEQMLLNLVRLRYHEPVLFLEVSSLTSSFSLGANASASAVCVGTTMITYQITLTSEWMNCPLSARALT